MNVYQYYPIKLFLLVKFSYVQHYQKPVGKLIQLKILLLWNMTVPIKFKLIVHQRNSIFFSLYMYTYRRLSQIVWAERKFCFNFSTQQYLLPQNLLRRPFHFHKNNIWEDITEFNENSVLCYLRNTIFTILINFILMEHNFSSLFFIFKFNKRRIFVY